MVIKITDHVTRCHTNNDGEKIFNLIKPLIDKGNKVELSFNGIDSITSSFVNSAFIELLQYFEFSHIRSRLNFISTNKSINQIIRKRFKFETEDRQKLELREAI
ncbi:STAS-like domain-containing protein [Desulfonema magnum]|uniref:DUF4325 domain-containing protein n=1 Tax=Desulfonema magnum TaxID=45655 RepID=A0A975BHR3_9BACT|nr:STAS-like domain-containing protein [Desulfonema magnum]QTA85434.1 Uncharacterized protein dnm_014440 [Desulfonema magnum]